MKPLKFLLPAVLASPAVVPLVSAVADDKAASRLSDDLMAHLAPADLPQDPDLLASAEVRQPPSSLTAAPGSSTAGVVRFGDTLVKIAERYGLTLAELLRLNPGLDTARLVVGTQVRVAQSAPGRTQSLLAVKPLTSGGASWPDLPGFEGESRQPFRTAPQSTTWIWPTISPTRTRMRLLWA
ncbi:MAG: LysM domain-containing protein [Synechococcaceae cyanobacterium]|nr:LysM domain-containing protein [Synechococcaceae cyanobacterium]